jgi:hypothetical protein
MISRRWGVGSGTARGVGYAMLAVEFGEHWENYIVVYRYVRIGVYIYMYIYICIYVYMYICIYVYMFLCIYVYMYICIYV